VIFEGKRNVLGVMVDAVDMDGAVDRVVQAARSRAPFSVTALAVHGLMTGVFDKEYRYLLNHLDLIVPDGQPVRWALNWIHGAKLSERVYGPDLTLGVCRRAAQEGLPIYLYGSTSDILGQLQSNLLARFPGLEVAGTESSRFRRISAEEKAHIVASICRSGASIVFVGTGCPRQEVWAFNFRDCLSIPVVAVGAAFPFLAGELPQAPQWMQRRGLEWLFRLVTEPKRLWKRYLFLNPIYLVLFLLQKMRILKFRDGGALPSREILWG
jgi:N-acetylglucosaminyldiphosphoundecaprenol N-acetyl-beta-D-mannosaminyltransferase